MRALTTKHSAFNKYLILKAIVCKLNANITHYIVSNWRIIFPFTVIGATDKIINCENKLLQTIPRIIKFYIILIFEENRND